jgi:hypothetical protein
VKGEEVAACCPRHTQVFRARDYSFRIYFNENNEPPHIHVTRGGTARGRANAKFWLNPVTLCDAYNFGAADLRWATSVVQANETFFMEQWHVVQTKKR